MPIRIALVLYRTKYVTFDQIAEPELWDAYAMLSDLGAAGMEALMFIALSFLKLLRLSFASESMLSKSILLFPLLGEWLLLFFCWPGIEDSDWDDNLFLLNIKAVV